MPNPKLLGGCYHISLSLSALSLICHLSALFSTPEETKKLRHKETNPTKPAKLLSNQTTITYDVLGSWSLIAAEAERTQSSSPRRPQPKRASAPSAPPEPRSLARAVSLAEQRGPRAARRVHVETMMAALVARRRGPTAAASWSPHGRRSCTRSRARSFTRIDATLFLYYNSPLPPSPSSIHHPPMSLL